MREKEREEKSAINDFEKITNMLTEWAEKKIRLVCEEQEKVFVLRLKTESCLEGITPNDFLCPEANISFLESKNDPKLLYKNRELFVPDVYRMSAWLLKEIERKEKQTHHSILLGQTEVSITRYLREGKCSSHFPRVYAVCTKHFQEIPPLEEITEKDLRIVKEKLIEVANSLEIGWTYRISGLYALKKIQWADKDISTFAFDPVETYFTGDPDSMQFREDLERYSMLANK